jgi:ABC-type branched-subunit amino acid transport system substrate-binding protein
MNRRFLAGFLLAAVFFISDARAQSTDSLPKFKTYHVGIFAPLYLDSVFSTAGNFRYREGIPKFIVPGLDFVYGAEAALDSLKLNQENVEAAIYDTRSYSHPINTLISNKKLDNLDLIIGSVKDADYKQLADLALNKNIPFISVTYPNDGGISKNPFVLVVNSTLRSHCEAIFSYIIQNHGTDKIFLCRKKGAQEDKVAAYFKSFNEQEGRQLLNIQTLNFDSTISPEFLKTKLDSNRQTVFIGGSLDESFALKLAVASNALSEKYPITLFGMPNWDGFKSLLKSDELEDFPIFFTTPYFNSKGDSYSKQLIENYYKRTKGRPTDMAFKGFECTYMFTKLLTQFPNDFMSHVNDKSLKVFSDYNFRPVMLNKNAMAPDYFENKHLYFIKILNGGIYKAW